MNALVCRTRRHRRGALMYGFAGILVVMATASALIAQAALGSYMSSVQAERRLAAFAAAEGAAALVALDPAQERDEPVAIGRARVAAGEARQTEETLSVPLAVTLLGPEETEVETLNYVAVYRQEGDGPWTLVSLTLGVLE